MNEILVFATIWMDLEQWILVKSVRQISYYLYVESKKMNNKTEMD